MDKKLKILLLTAPYGHGHYSVANNLMKVFDQHENIEYVLYDLYTEDYPLFANVTKRLYLKTYKKGIPQQTYKYFYYESEKILKLKMAKPYLRLGIRKVMKKIAEVKPDLILNTFPVNCTYILQEEGIDIPVYNLITDYNANYNWIGQKIRKHFLALSSMKPQFTQFGISDSQLAVTGIPVDPIYYQKYSREEISQLRTKFHLDKDKRTLLIVAGAHGVVPNMKKIVSRFSQRNDIQLLIVCGKNIRLYRTLIHRFGQKKNCMIFPFVHNLDELMRVSDLMITKSGGITVTEAANIGIPLIIYRPVYGQELENALYLQKNNSAMVAFSAEELIYKVFAVLQNTILFKQIKKNIQKIPIKHSANRIINQILNDYKEVEYENYKNMSIKNGFI